ncbi:hypothetical protein IQ259_21740 [Fortiea sp. LEGE XX443]|uniref:hypothetical protein n=1 Tax=Fortiea sp. LEGE XX443 TaxID=1828611 RepID=UPI001880B34C|nr:hypothetical protein [Fortiea sp. LEGE XX443]MBE9007612.1 hypothetical protein [Fortiea sp. LEGE XX443]
MSNERNRETKDYYNSYNKSEIKKAIALRQEKCDRLLFNPVEGWFIISFAKAGCLGRKLFFLIKKIVIAAAMQQRPHFWLDIYSEAL